MVMVMRRIIPEGQSRKSPRGRQEVNVGCFLRANGGLRVGIFLLLCRRLLHASLLFGGAKPNVTPMRRRQLPVSTPFYRPMWLLAIGTGCGVLSWAAAKAASGSFEPYDSSSGLAVNQIVLCVPAILLACRFRLALLLIYLLGAWLGMNTYAYALGGSEQRAWAMLGAVTSLLLLVLPLSLAGMTAASRYIWFRWRATDVLHTQRGK